MHSVWALLINSDMRLPIYTKPDRKRGNFLDFSYKFVLFYRYLSLGAENLKVVLLVCDCCCFILYAIWFLMCGFLLNWLPSTLSSVRSALHAPRRSFFTLGAAGCPFLTLSLAFDFCIPVLLPLSSACTVSVTKWALQHTDWMHWYQWMGIHRDVVLAKRLSRKVT